jgi:hypothetical protein
MLKRNGNTMGRKEFRSKDFVEWINLMEKNCFIRQIDLYLGEEKRSTAYVLRTPVIVQTAAKVIEKLKSKYNPEYEIGGILLAEPILIDGEKTLQIEKARLLKNISKKPQSSYLGKDEIGAMHRGLMGTKGGRRYFPITFHSHPQHKEDKMYFVRDFLQLSTSEADKKLASKVLRYNTIGLTLVFPSALIYIIDDGLFLGFYGGKIAPDDFREYMRRLAGKSVQEIIAEVTVWADTGWKKVIAVVGGVLGAISFAFLASHPQVHQAFINEIAVYHTSSDEIPTYFALTKIGDARISIPDISTNND